MTGEKTFLQRAVEVTEDEVARLKVKLAHAETALKFYADEKNYIDGCAPEIVLCGDTIIENGKPQGGARAVFYFKTFPD